MNSTSGRRNCGGALHSRRHDLMRSRTGTLRTISVTVPASKSCRHSQSFSTPPVAGQAPSRSQLRHLYHGAEAVAGIEPGKCEISRLRRSVFTGWAVSTSRRSEAETALMNGRCGWIARRLLQECLYLEHFLCSSAFHLVIAPATLPPSLPIWPEQLTPKMPYTSALIRGKGLSWSTPHAGQRDAIPAAYALRYHRHGESCMAERQRRLTFTEV